MSHVTTRRLEGTEPEKCMNALYAVSDVTPKVTDKNTVKKTEDVSQSLFKNSRV